MYREPLEEYRSLRTELLSLYSRQDSRLALAWAGAAGLLGYAAASRIPELGFLAFALVVAAWRDHLNLGDGVVRISVYIEVVLESAVPGLRWEGINAAATSIGRPSGFGLVRAIVLSSYGTFSTVVIAATAALFALQPVPQTRWASDAALAALCAVAMLWIVVRDYRSARRRPLWKQRFQHVVDVQGLPYSLGSQPTPADGIASRRG